MKRKFSQEVNSEGIQSSYTELKKDRRSGENALGTPVLIGVIPPLVKPSTPRKEERRFINEQKISLPDTENHPGTTRDKALLATKETRFESTIKAERPDIVEVTLPAPKSKKPCPTPSSTPKPVRRAPAEQKNLLSQRIIFLNDHNNNCKSYLDVQCSPVGHNCLMLCPTHSKEP